jgi:hypothetical protein
MRDVFEAIRLIFRLHLMVLQGILQFIQAIGPRRAAIGCGFIMLLVFGSALLMGISQATAEMAPAENREKMEQIVFIDLLILVPGLLWVFSDRLAAVWSAGRHPGIPGGTSNSPAHAPAPSSGDSLGMAQPSDGSDYRQMPAVTPAQGIGRFMGLYQYRGRVRRCHTRQERQREWSGEVTDIQIWNLLVELDDGNNTRCQAEMRGTRIEGMLEEDDEVIVLGKMSRGNVIQTSYIRNLTANCDISVTQG